MMALLLSVGAATALPAVARAQTAAATRVATAAATIDPGMTRDQVVTKLGEPLSSRDYDGYTYLLYRNGCERTCGMNDLVVLDSGKVIDAVFRSPARHYTGTSSSPHMIPAPEARKQRNGTGEMEMPAHVAAKAAKTEKAAKPEKETKPEKAAKADKGAPEKSIPPSATKKPAT